MKCFKYLVAVLFLIFGEISLIGQGSIDVILTPKKDSLSNKLVLVEYVAKGVSFTGFEGYWSNQLITIAWNTNCGIVSSAPNPMESVKILPDSLPFKGLFSKSESPVFFKPSDIGSIDDGYIYSCFYAEIDAPIALDIVENERKTILIIDVPDNWILDNEKEKNACVTLRTKPFYDKNGKMIPYTFSPIINNAATGKNEWINAIKKEQE